MQLPGLDQPEMQGTAGILQIRRVQGTVRALEQNIQSADSFSPLWATIICPNSHKPNLLKKYDVSLIERPPMPSKSCYYSESHE